MNNLFAQHNKPAHCGGFFFVRCFPARSPIAAVAVRERLVCSKHVYTVANGNKFIVPLCTCDALVRVMLHLCLHLADKLRQIACEEDIAVPLVCLRARGATSLRFDVGKTAVPAATHAGICKCSPRSPCPVDRGFHFKEEQHV